MMAKKLTIRAIEKEQMTPGWLQITAFKSLEYALNEARKPTIVDHFIAGPGGSPDSRKPEYIEVRASAVQTLIKAFNRYFDSDGEIPMEESFLLKKPGKGNKSGVKTYKKRHRNILIAMEVENKINEEHLSRKESIKLAAEKFCVSEDTVSDVIKPVKRSDYEKWLNTEWE